MEPPLRNGDPWEATGGGHLEVYFQTGHVIAVSHEYKQIYKCAPDYWSSAFMRLKEENHGGENTYGIRPEETINEGADGRRNSSWGTHASPVYSGPNRAPLDRAHGQGNCGHSGCIGHLCGPVAPTGEGTEKSQEVTPVYHCPTGESFRLPVEGRIEAILL